MLTIGITGGIGSGKTTICRIFEVLGSPVFYADTAAREVMENDSALRAQIMALLGEEAYPAGKIDRKAIAGKVFGDAEKLAALNALVHPATARTWEAFQKKHHTAPYLIKEAAILFESGAHKTVDKTICITAPEALRLSRAMARDGSSEEAIRSRMARQMPEEEKLRLCDFKVVNDDVEAVLPQVLGLDARFRKEEVAVKIYDYLLRVWGSTVLCVPFLTIIALMVFEVKHGTFALKHYSDLKVGLPFIAMAAFIGLLLSLPTLGIACRLFPFLARRIKRTLPLKIIFALTINLCVIATMALLFGRGVRNPNDFYEAMKVSLYYGIAAALFCFLYRIQPKNQSALPSEN